MHAFSFYNPIITSSNKTSSHRESNHSLPALSSSLQRKRKTFELGTLQIYIIMSNWSISSDSEDDCDGNAALKLQKLKNKLKEEQKIASTFSKPQKNVPADQSDLIEDGGVLDEILANNKKVLSKGKPRATRSRARQKKVDETAATSSCSDVIEDGGVLDEILANNKKLLSKGKPRATRSRARQKKLDETAATSSCSDVTTNTSTNTNTRPKKTAARGRKRGRGATPSPRARGRARRMTYWAPLGLDPSIPTYSIGNTHEYPDMSDNQALFSSKTNDSTVELNDSIEENEELSVKVYWQSAEFFKFTIRKFQKLTQIFDYFAKKENVSYDNLLFTYNERILNPNDTPDVIDYSIAKFIDGGIVNEDVSSLKVRKDVIVKDGIKIKFQCQLLKKPYETFANLDEKLSLVMMKFAEHVEKPLNKLKFLFDGDSLSGKSTPRELELEGGECIDVVILS